MCTSFGKVSLCIYFTFAIHLGIARFVGSKDVVLMSRLRLNTPCFRHEPEEPGVCLYCKGGKRPQDLSWQSGGQCGHSVKWIHELSRVGA